MLVYIKYLKKIIFHYTIIYIKFNQIKKDWREKGVITEVKD